MTKIETIITTAKLPEDKAIALRTNFAEFQAVADEWKAKADAIIVNGPEDKAQIKEAREGRLSLKGKRVEIEKRRKALKENALKEGQTIDAVAKALTALISPIEDALEEKEKIVERIEARRKEALRTARAAMAAPLAEYIPALDFATLTEEDFDRLMAGAELQKAAAEKAVEDARIAAEAKAKADAEERQRVAAENARLRAEAEAQAAELAKVQEAARIEREAAEKKAREAAAEIAKAQAEAERVAREAREAEEKKARELAEAKAKADAEAKAAAAAPDKEKLLAFADMLDALEVPACTELAELSGKVEILILKVVNHIREGVK
jgi:hypothetical protein